MGGVRRESPGTVAVRKVRQSVFFYYYRITAHRILFLTTSIIIPISGLMLIESWGGLHGAPWAWNAYLAFWLMAAISITPDMIRYGRNRNSDDPKHGMVSGAIRGNLALILTVYIICCMVLKISWITPFAKLTLFG